MTGEALGLPAGSQSDLRLLHTIEKIAENLGYRSGYSPKDMCEQFAMMTDSDP